MAPAATTVDLVDQGIVYVASAEKREVLAGLLGDPSLARVLVFTRTKHGADRVVRHLEDAGINAIAIHGNKSQPQRERALASFRAGRTRVLVAMDIASRGIDIESVSHVINFELPNVPEDYVHRIGRTARAGAAGTAISFCSDEERTYLHDIEKLIRRTLRVLPSCTEAVSDRRIASPPAPGRERVAAPRRAPQVQAGRFNGSRNARKRSGLGL